MLLNFLILGEKGYMIIIQLHNKYNICCIIKVVHMLLKLLEDKNGEVQNLTVKW